MKFPPLPRPLLSLFLGLSVVLAGCGGLGKGVLPVNAVIQPFGGLEGAATAKAFTCLNTGISLLLDFSDGSRGDFTARATYSSSNPAVARVSNLDVPVPDQANTFYARGVIVPVAAGTTTITAQYLTFTRSIEVTVSPLLNFTLVPAEANLATRSRLDLAAFADLDGVTTPIDAAVVWSIVSPNTAIATIDSIAGTLTGVAPGTGLTAQARLPGCNQTAEAPVTVANLQSLALTREFGANDKLIVSTSERLIATGTLDNGMTQDLSTQVAYTSSNTSALSFFTGTLSNIALAITATDSPVQVAASFDNMAVTAPAIGIQPVADVLNTIAVSPVSTQTSPGLTAQFRATGSYASGASQEITRHVTWSSSDTTLAAVQTTNSFGINALAGLASTSSAAAGRNVTITATATSGAGASITSSGTLAIQ